MATPRMLAPRDPAPTGRPAGPDPIAGLSAILLGLLAAGLLAAAITATYGFYVPPVETPIVGALAALFGLILALNLAALGARRLRGRGR